MLVHYHRGFVLKGYGDFTKRKWFKKVTTREPMYLSTGVNGICDETEVEAELVKKIGEEMARMEHWADANFSGWLEICTNADELRKYFPWQNEDFVQKMVKSEVTTTPVNEWSMKKIIDNLTGAQFAQFCKENDISGIVL